MKNHSKLRILLFSPKGAGDHYYGPGMNAFRMYNTLDDKDVSITLLHGYKNQKDYDLFHEQVFISEIENKNIFLGLVFLWKAKRWIKKNAHRFDVVHCLTAFQHSFMVAYWFEKKGVPVFIKIGQSDHTGFQNNSIFSKISGLNRFRKKNANRITGYISISSVIKKKLTDAGIKKDKIYDVPNGVDTTKFVPASSSEKKKIRDKLGLKDCFTILFTGAFSERKNPLLVAEAFAGMESAKDSQLLLIGPDTDNGEQRKRINELIRERHLENIHVMEFTASIAEFYKASDIFVLPSSQEGFSNSMLEAQASGLPAMVTKISGATEMIVDGENGRFIERTPESIRVVLEKYVKGLHPLDAESVNARRKAVELYSTEKILGLYLELFSNAIE